MGRLLSHQDSLGTAVQYEYDSGRCAQDGASRIKKLTPHRKMRRERRGTS